MNKANQADLLAQCEKIIKYKFKDISILEKGLIHASLADSRQASNERLEFLGDSILGKNVNVGAGTITCNYDGVNKNKTNISDNVFIGSNTSLVAPIKIGKNSIIGAGSSISRNVKDKSLSLTRSPQVEVKNYKRK